MITAGSTIGLNQFVSVLSSGNGTLVLSTLLQLESQPPNKQIVQIVHNALESITDPVIAFQVKKTFRLLRTLLQGRKIAATAETVEKLIDDPARLDDLGLVVSVLVQPEAILAADVVRNAGWQNFPLPVLPTFCKFFSEFGNLSDVPAILELCRSHDPTVLTAALAAMEKLDPENMKEIIVPLLESPTPQIRGQAIEALYRWNKGPALKYLGKMLFSAADSEVLLAMHHATRFPFVEIEPLLMRFLAQSTETSHLMKAARIMIANAHMDLPFKLYWMARSLKDHHQKMIKGIILGVAKALVEMKITRDTIQEFLEKLKERVQKQEDQLIRDSMKIDDVHEEAQEAPEQRPRGASALSGPALVESINEYDTLDVSARIKLLGSMDLKTYNSFKTRIPGLFSASKGKELAALTKLIGRFGSSSEAKMIKPLLKSSDANEVCAAITALSKLDTEYLCLYLPQYMQDKNGKIRMHATRALVAIDRDSISRLLLSLYSSSAPKMRTVAVSASMLVDFTLIRESLINAFRKETIPELIEKMGLVLAANPDREILQAVYRAEQEASAQIAKEKHKVTISVADKLSVALDKIATPEELLQAEEEAVKAEQATALPPPPRSERPNPEGDFAPIQNVKTILTSEKVEVKEKRAQITILVWIIVAVVWGAMLIAIISNFLFGS